MKIHPKDIGMQFPRKLKAHRKRIPGDEKEATLQDACEMYLHVKDLTFLHIPDGIYKFIFGNILTSIIAKYPRWYGWLQAVRGLISRYLLGMPDLFIFDGGRYLAIELKTRTGKVRQGQQKIHRKIPVRVIRDFPTFKEVIDEWLDAPMACPDCLEKDKLIKDLAEKLKDKRVF